MMAPPSTPATTAPTPEDIPRLRARIAALSREARRLAASADRARSFPVIGERLAQGYELRAVAAVADVAATREALRVALRAVPCGARCRDGHPCGAPANGRGGRCKLHGGRSTGPRTAEGLARARAALAHVNELRAASRATTATAPQ